MTARELYAEGVLSCGRVGSVLYVLTKRRVRIFHVDTLPVRRLDAWGVQNAIARIERGFSLEDVSRHFGMHPRDIHEQLTATGWTKPGRERFLGRGR